MSAIDALAKLSSLQVATSHRDEVVKAGFNPKDVAEIKNSSEEFEAMFMEIMLRTMREAIPKSGLVDGGNAEDIYSGMLDYEYAKTMAAQRTSGIADSLEKELLTAIQKQAKTAEISAGQQAYRDAAEKAVLRDPEKQGTIEHSQ